MFIQTRPVKLYSLKFITDCALRSDQPSVKNLTPFRGMSDIVDRFGSNKETVARLEDLFEGQPDFDADKKKPTLDENYIGESTVDDFKDMLHDDATTITYSPAEHDLDFPHYYRRIEDIHENYFADYIGNIVFNIRNKSGGLKDFERNHKDAYSYVSIGDDGEEVTESADLLVGAQVDLGEVATVEEANLKLPFVVKRLWNFSKLTKINILSYIRAYLIAKELNEKALRMGSSTATLKPNDVIRVGIYKCNAAGGDLSLVDVDNKNVHAKNLFSWITGASSEYKSYYRNYRDFLIYCAALNIDIRNDDMTKYDKDFISKLQVTTVTPNELYDSMVVEAIKSGKGQAQQIEEAETPTGENSVSNTIRMYNDYILSSENEQRNITNMSTRDQKTIENVAKYILMQARRRNPRGSEGTNISDISWREGFMYYCGNPVLIPCSMVCSSISDPGSIYDYALISNTGAFVKLTPTFFLQRCMLLDVFNYLSNKWGTDTHVEVPTPKWEQLTL